MKTQKDSKANSRKFLVLLPFATLFIVGLLIYSMGPTVQEYTQIVPQTRTQILFKGENLIIPSWGYRYSGPYNIESGRDLIITWEADSTVNVYIMNDIDWASRLFGAPSRWRYASSGREGSITYNIQHKEPLYIQVMSPTWSVTKLYKWEEKVVWTEYVEEKITKLDYQRQNFGLGLMLFSGSLTILASAIIASQIHSSQSMRFCIYCGSKIPQNSNFCMYCGKTQE